MKATYRKVAGHASFYALVIDEGRPVWLCSHSHSSRKQANACAKGNLRKLPRTGDRALRLLHRTWTPHNADFPKGIDGRPVLRRSYVESFLQCVQYTGADSPDAAFGQVAHSAIHAYWQLCIATGEESRLADIDRLVHEAFFRTPGADVDRYSEAQQLVYDFCSSRLLEAHRLLVLDRRPVIEFELTADIGWAVLTGHVDRIDRIDGDDQDDPPRIIRIRDYKSGFAQTGGKALENGAAPGREGETRVIPHEFQRRFYTMLAFLDPRLGKSLEAVETEIDYMRYHGVPEVIVYERGELDVWWRDMMWALLDRWQKRTAPPTGCASCEHCALRASCGAALVESKQVPFDAVGALDLVQRWIRAQAVAASLRDSAVAYFQHHAPLNVNGLEVGFLRPRKSTWKVVKPMEIASHLNAAGLEGQAVLYTWADEKKVPSHMKAGLAEIGAAKYEMGAPAFKSRKAGED